MTYILNSSVFQLFFIRILAVQYKFSTVSVMIQHFFFARFPTKTRAVPNNLPGNHNDILNSKVQTNFRPKVANSLTNLANFSPSLANFSPNLANSHPNHRNFRPNWIPAANYQRNQSQVLRKVLRVKAEQKRSIDF